MRGNHEQLLAERIAARETDPDAYGLRMHPWFAGAERADWGRWKAMVEAMPVAATIRTRAGAVGLVHAAPAERDWDTLLAKLADGDADTMWLALNSTARARQDARRAAHEGVPIDGPITGVRAVLTGHTILDDVVTTGNVWHIDTGAGSPRGRLTLARIDVDPIAAVATWHIIDFDPDNRVSNAIAEDLARGRGFH